MCITLLLLGCGLAGVVDDGTPVEQSAEEHHPAALTRCRQPLRSCPGRGRKTHRNDEAETREPETMMRNLQYQLKQLCARNKEGSFATRAQRERMLALIADHLWQMGYRTLDVRGLKGRHVNRLVARWQAERLSPGTMKNRLRLLLMNRRVRYFSG